jgi:hypothetical protein
MDTLHHELKKCHRCGDFGLEDNMELCANCDSKIIKEIQQFINTNKGVWNHVRFDDLAQSVQQQRPDLKKDQIIGLVEWYQKKWSDHEVTENEEKSKEQFSDELVELRKSIAEFIHKVGHPLTVLVGYVDLAILDMQRGDESKEQLLEYLTESKKLCMEVNDIVKQLGILTKGNQ